MAGWRRPPGILDRRFPQKFSTAFSVSLTDFPGILMLTDPLGARSCAFIPDDRGAPARGYGHGRVAR